MKALGYHYDCEYEIVKQDSHRNGVGGAPFVVTLIHAIMDGEEHQFVATSFYGDSKARFSEQTSLLDINELKQGNIEFAEGNSWRGSDMFGDVIADAWQERCMSNPDFPYNPFEE